MWLRRVPRGFVPKAEAPRHHSIEKEIYQMAVVTDVVSSLSFEGSDKALRIVDFAFDGAYPAGGEAISAADLGLLTIDDLQAHNKGLTDFIAVWQNATAKLAVIVPSTGLEAGAGVAGALVVRAIAVGSEEA